MELYDISTDVEKRNAGVWVKHVKDGGDAEFLVVGAASKKIEALDIELQDSRPSNYETNLQVQWERNRWEGRQRAKAGLLDFKNVKFAGKDFPYEKQAVDALIDDERFFTFVLVVVNAMRKADETRLAFEAETEKN